MALKKLNFLLMFFLINLLRVSLCEPGLDTSAMDQPTGTVPDMVNCPNSYHFVYHQDSFKSFSPGTDFLNTFPSSNTSYQNGKCGTHDSITDWYGSALIIISGTTLTISNICFILHLIWAKRYKHDSVKGKRDNPNGSHKPKTEPNLSPIASRVKIFTFADLQAATFGFLPETRIIKGDYNTVYRGCLPDGSEVAIKRSSTRGYKHEIAFQIELNVLTEVRHNNLTSLIGYCTENDERMLVFEYVKNGTLYDQLYDTNSRPNSPFHTWKLRIKILLNCAKGIEFLQKHASRGIIHRDITPSNILLDENWNARISDLDLALVGPEPGVERVYVNQAVGTMGYKDPDCNSATRSVTLKTDVYSFGVVMIQMLTADEAYIEDDNLIYADFIAPKILAGKLPIYLDRRPELPVGIDAQAVHLIGRLAERCIRRSGRLRPTISEVVQEIEYALSLFD